MPNLYAQLHRRYGKKDGLTRREMIQRANGGSTFPQVFVGDVHVGGCDDLHELDAQGRLDGLLATGTLK